MMDVFSNNSEVAFTPDGLRALAVRHAPRELARELAAYENHRLSARLGATLIEEIINRYRSGESATTLAQEHGVAPSALLRLLRDRNVVVRKHRVSPERATAMAREYEARATMAELEKKYGLSHGAVYRALHRAGVEMRASAPRKLT